MSARCRGCGHGYSESDEPSDGLCVGCYVVVLYWGRRHKLDVATREHDLSLPPVTVDAWLEAGAPGAREP